MPVSNEQRNSYYNHRLTTFLKIILISSTLFISISNTVSANRAGKRRNHDQKGNRYGKTAEESLKLSSPEECLRTCNANESPKTCYYKFVLEHYPVLGEACDYCTPNYTNPLSSDCQCILANGVERVFLSVSRQLPGPSIQVCLGDRIIVDVENQMEGMETTIHWHGLLQEGTPYYDGVPQLTQCSIPHGTTFRYQFGADNAGTHFWHAHTGLQKMDGIHGSLIVRESPRTDPNSYLYDYDKPDHVILMSDWLNTLASERFPGTRMIHPGQVPDSILINGRGQYRDLNTGNVTNTTSASFHVSSGKRYRFRLINTWSTTCPSEFFIEGHIMTVIATDGVAVKARDFAVISSLSGERYDFIVDAVQPPGSYWIHVRGLGECSNIRLQQTAILQYEGAATRPISAEPTYDQQPPPGLLLNPLDGNCIPNRTDALCINHLESKRPVDQTILKLLPDVKIIVSFRFKRYTYNPNTYGSFLVPPNLVSAIAVVNNISYQVPPSPPLSQIKDIPSGIFCNESTIPDACLTPDVVCRCTNVMNISKDSVVELIILDGMGVVNLKHPFHLHGYFFHVIGMGLLSDPNVTKISAYHVRRMDSKNMLPRKLQSPPAKDTIAIPTNGYIIARFKATNPGYWLLHCHFLYHVVIGMQIVFHVGTHEDLPPVPAGFPTCGNYLPPITDEY